MHAMVSARETSPTCGAEIAGSNKRSAEVMAIPTDVDSCRRVVLPVPSAVASPVEDVGRLLLRCADRPGLVAAVSEFFAEAGANIVSLDQHSTEQSGGTFMQRTIFHLPGLTAARDALERDFS